MTPGSSIGGERHKAGVTDEENQLWIAKFPCRSVAPNFRVSPSKAKAIISQINEAVSGGRHIAKEIGISTTEQNAMETPLRLIDYHTARLSKRSAISEDSTLGYSLDAILK